MGRIGSLLALVVGAWMLASGSPAGAADACKADGKVGYVCGPANAEDMVLTPGTSRIVVSGMTGPGRTAGGLYLVDAQLHTSMPLTPDVSGPAQAPFKACPGPLDLAKFAPHGLALRAGLGAIHTLYVVNHGGRESIEVFKLDARSAEPVLRWVGCVVLPEGASGNAVAPLPHGGFVATKFETAGDAQAFQKMAALQNTGGLYEWSPRGGFSLIPGSDMPGANGVAASADGKWIYANSWPAQKVLRFRRGSSEPPVAVSVDFLPDNLRWAPNGTLLVGGQASDIKTLLSCDKARCAHAWSVARLDPKTMKVTPVLHVEGTDAFSDATVGLQVGHEVWVGTYRGDRIVHMAIGPGL